MQTTMPRGAARGRWLVIVLGLDPARARDEAEQWRALGAVVMQASDAAGCLRVATSARPHVIVLDRGAPKRLVQLLKAHPVSARAEFRWMSAASSGVHYRAA